MKVDQINCGVRQVVGRTDSLSEVNVAETLFNNESSQAAVEVVNTMPQGR
jgi:hypothetical protein